MLKKVKTKECATKFALHSTLCLVGATIYWSGRWMQRTEFAFRESGSFVASYVGYAVNCANRGKHVGILLFSLAARGMAFGRIFSIIVVGGLGAVKLAYLAI